MHHFGYAMGCIEDMMKQKDSLEWGRQRMGSYWTALYIES